jgi:uncharacterized membrane protein YkvI
VQAKSTWFQRIILPGFAFKAVVIGGGYATGRELATYFLPSGPWGGLLAMVLSMAIWSAVCTATFLFALQTRSTDYKAFFRNLLGPFWPTFEVAYFCALIVILAVFAAAGGAIGQSLFGVPLIAGSLILMAGIVLVATWGNDAVERLFKYVTVFLYATYAVFVLLSMWRFGDRMLGAFSLHPPMTGWATGGLTYAGYNVMAAVAVLPVTRHMTGRRDAITAGLLSGPLAMIPAILFFLCMVAYYPEIAGQTLPSDFLLQKLNLPAFRVVFQLMIFAALLESGTGSVHAINERLAHAYQARGRRFTKLARLGVTLVAVTGSVFVAARFGLVQLIASGYTWLAYAILLIFVLPLMTLGVMRLIRQRREPILPQTSPETA